MDGGKRISWRDDASKLEEKCTAMQEAMKDFLKDKERSIDKSRAIKNALEELSEYTYDVEEKYKQFASAGKSQSNTFHFWHKYLHDVKLSLDYMKTEKRPDWQLHLATCADIMSMPSHMITRIMLYGALFILLKCFCFLKLPQRFMPCLYLGSILFGDQYQVHLIMSGLILVWSKVSLKILNQEQEESKESVDRSQPL